MNCKICGKEITYNGIGEQTKLYKEDGYCTKCYKKQYESNYNLKYKYHEENVKNKINRKCNNCGETKSINEFTPAVLNKNKTTVGYSHCKRCENLIKTNRYHNKRNNLYLWAGGKCIICGYDKVVSLDFHHVYPDQKEYTINSLKSLDIDTIKKEVHKCVLLCRNCHGEFHSSLGTITQEMIEEKYNEILKTRK
jgi:hypothetical protein